LNGVISSTRPRGLHFSRGNNWEGVGTDITASSRKGRRKLTNGADIRGCISEGCIWEPSTDRIGIDEARPQGNLSSLHHRSLLTQGFLFKP